MRESSDISEGVEEEEGEYENRESEDDVEEEEVLSASPLNYAMEMPSPDHNPYWSPIYAHELDPNFDEDYEARRLCGR